MDIHHWHMFLAFPVMWNVDIFKEKEMKYNTHFLFQKLTYDYYL